MKIEDLERIAKHRSVDRLGIFWSAEVDRQSG